jgi:hypothetical protein
MTSQDSDITSEPDALSKISDKPLLLTPENLLETSPLDVERLKESTAHIIELVMQKAFQEITLAAKPTAIVAPLDLLHKPPKSKPLSYNSILDLENVREYLKLFGVNFDESASSGCDDPDSESSSSESDQPSQHMTAQQRETLELINKR